jgi:hypothetical protein
MSLKTWSQAEFVRENIESEPEVLYVFCQMKLLSSSWYSRTEFVERLASARESRLSAIHSTRSILHANLLDSSLTTALSQAVENSLVLLQCVVNEGNLLRLRRVNIEGVCPKAESSSTSGQMKVIDLTSSPRSPRPAPVDTPEAQLIEPAEPPQKSRSRRRKQKQAASVVEEGEVAEEEPVKTTKKPRQKRSRSRSREREPAKETRRDKRRREHQSRDRDRKSPPRRRSRSPEPRRRDRERSPLKTVDDTQLFFVDTKPVPVPENLTAKPSTSSAPISDLILPAHVAVVGSNVVAVEIHSSVNAEEENEDDYIDYLDYDDDRRVRVHVVTLNLCSIKSPRLV